MSLPEDVELDSELIRKAATALVQVQLGEKIEPR